MFKRSGLLVMAVLFFVVGAAMAQEEAKTVTAGAAMEAAVPAASVNVGNKVCPVTGNDIDKLGENTVEYQGKIYNLCCPACKDEFLKDPDKYVTKVAEEMAKEQAVPAVQVQQ